MAADTICSDFGAPKNKVCHCFHCFPIYLPREKHNSKRYMHSNVHFSIIYNIQDMETTQMSINREWIKMWYIYAMGYCVYSVAQLCLTLCYPMDCSPAGSSAHGIYQARTLECTAISYSRGSSQLRN